MFNISVLLDVQANLPETSPFLPPNGFGEHLFSNVLIVLEMYSFECKLKTTTMQSFKVSYENFVFFHFHLDKYCYSCHNRPIIDEFVAMSSMKKTPSQKVNSA